MSKFLRKVALTSAVTLVISTLGVSAVVGVDNNESAVKQVDDLPPVGPDGSPLNAEAITEIRTTEVGKLLNGEAMHRPGYASVALDDDGAVVLYWAGDRSEGRSIVDQVRMSNSDVPVLVVFVDFTLDELAAEGERVYWGAKDIPGFVGVGPSADGSGLRVMAIAGSELSKMDEQGIAKIIDSSYPVTHLEIVESGFRTNSRQSDTGTFDAGAKIDGGCSSGFTAFRDGVRGMLTAAHCTGGLDSTVRHNGVSRGTVGLRSTSADVSWFRGYSGDYSSWVYYGAYNTSTRRSQDGRVAARVPIGNHICLSGAASGSFCGIRVDAYNQTITTDFGTMTGAILTTRTTTGGVGGYGDSGAGNMIYTWDSQDSRWQSVAVGLHAASAGSASCVGIATQCGSTGAHVEVARLATLYGIEVINVPG